MNAFVLVIAAFAAAQRPVPPINFSLPGQGLQAPAPVGIPADAEILPFQEASVINRPAPAVRHFLLASAPRIPEHGAPFTVRCLVDRRSGRTTHCQDPAVFDPYRGAVVALGLLYQFRLTPAQAAGGQRPLAVTVAGRLVPADVHPRDSLFEFVARPPANVTFAATMTGEQSEAYYPKDALTAGLEGRYRLDCQVQPDLSLFCLNPAAAAGTDPGPFLAQFQIAALQLSGWLRAAPTLTSGAPAAGTIFRTTITFRLPQ
jgi:hypothetical protein